MGLVFQADWISFLFVFKGSGPINGHDKKKKKLTDTGLCWFFPDNWISYKNLLDGCLQGQLDLDDSSFGIGFY